MGLIISLIAVRDEASEAAMARTEREIACDDAVLGMAWELLASAQYGQSSRERAAFVFRDETGAYALQRWPFEAVGFRASFHGVMAEGTVAIIHTHPVGYDFPSTKDQLVARRMELPVYVLTRGRISKTNGVGVMTIWRGNWNPRYAGRRTDSGCVPSSLRAASTSMSADR